MTPTNSSGVQLPDVPPVVLLDVHLGVHFEVHLEVHLEVLTYPDNRVR